jgi:hypothetical protein
MPKLSLLIQICGGLHLSILLAGALMPQVLDWRRALAPLEKLTRQIIWIHGSFIVMVIVAFGIVSLTQSTALSQGSALARCICGFIAIFWGTRLMIQFFAMDPRGHLGNRFLRVGYHMLTIAFALFTTVYGLAAVLH